MPRNYSTSLEGMVEILGHEGIALQLYLDSVDVRTIGAGATVSEIPNIKSLPWTYSITMDEAIELFKKSLKKYEDGINKALNVDVTQQQFDALVSFAYNVGYAGAAGSTAMKRLNAGESKARVGQALMMWTKPVEITARRNKERLLFETGAYQNGGKALLFPVNPVTHKPQYAKGKEVDVKKLITGVGPIVEKEAEKAINPTTQNTTNSTTLDKPETPVLQLPQEENKSGHPVWDFFINLIRSVMKRKQ